jgi:hypothetical protein
LDRHLVSQFLAHRGNRVTHFPDNALQIVGGYTEPFFQASNLLGIGKVNLVSTGLRLGVVHLGCLPRRRLIALADDWFRQGRVSRPDFQTGTVLLCRQPTPHLGSDAQTSGFPERVASPLTRRHLARFGDHFGRSGIPIMALHRLDSYSPRRRSNHHAFPE